MARSDIIIKLLKAALANDRTLMHNTAEAMIAEERKKQHHSFADRLEKTLQGTTTSFKSATN